MNKKSINILEELNKINFINVYNFQNGNSSKLLNQYGEEIFERNKIKNQFNKESKKLFNEFINLLNQYLGVKYDENYWRILIGPWFFVCVETLYNRVNSLSSFIKLNSNLTYIFENLKKDEFVTNTNLDFNNKLCSVNWNQLVIYKIIKNLNEKYTLIYTKNFKINLKKKFFFSLYLKNKIKFFLSKFLFLLNKFNKKLIFNTSLNSLDEIKLQIKVMKIPLFYLPDFFYGLQMKFKYNLKLRSNLINQFVKKEDDSKKKIIKKILIENLPTIYLENYEFFYKKIDESTSFDLIATSQHFDFNEYYKFLASKNYLNNCKLIYFQHGNVDGVDKFDVYNNHIKSSTKYYTWGWNHQFHDELNSKKKNIQKFYNIKSSGQKKFYLNNNFRNELIFFTCPIYKGIYFWDIQKKNQNLFNNQIKFLKELKQKIVSNIKIKYHPDEESYNKILSSKISDLNIHVKNEYNYKKISNYNNILSVYSYDSTGFYEHIALNKPTILYVENFEENVVEEAIPYYSKLRDVKIIHDNPESAAEFINSNWNNILQWWYSKNTQESLKVFSEKFSRYTDKPYKKIFDELNK